MSTPPDSPPPAGPGAAGAQSPGVSPGPLAPLVLLVDDNQLNVELVRCVLEADGLRLAVAMTAVDALQQLRQPRAERPALVLMDIQLPGVDGLSLTGQIKAQGLLPGVPIVAFTALAMKGDAQRLCAAGCDAYLSKPIDVSRFASQVRALLPPHG